MSCLVLEVERMVQSFAYFYIWTLHRPVHVSLPVHREYTYPDQYIGINDILCTDWDKSHIYVLVGINDILCTGRETCSQGTCIRGTSIRDKDIVSNLQMNIEKIVKSSTHYKLVYIWIFDSWECSRVLIAICLQNATILIAESNP